MDKVVRAVDVGYGNTKYVTGIEGNTLRCAHFASTAPVCASHEAREALGGKRRTLGIGIGDFTYEVGPDAHLAASYPSMDLARAALRAIPHPCRRIQDSRSWRGITSRIRSVLPGCQ